MLKKAKTERLIWIDITITLLALELMAYFYYGMRTIVISGLCVAVSVAAELISLRLMRKKFTADDLTCTSDALIIALMVPASINYTIPALACVFAVIAAKNIFGGRLNMIFSPAAAAYLFMLTSWKNDLLSYPEPYSKIGLLENSTDLVNSASYTFNNTGAMLSSDFEILLGNFSGPIGAVSILLLIVSAVILIFRKDISTGAFIGTIFGFAFLAYVCPVSGTRSDSVKYVLATNMILFAAVYIISDKRIAPKKNYYAFFYGLFIAVSSYVIMLTTGKENVIIILSVLFTPISLAFKNLQKKIDKETENESIIRLAELEHAQEETAIDNVSEVTTNDTFSEAAEVLTKTITEEKNNVVNPEGDESVE